MGTSLTFVEGPRSKVRQFVKKSANRRIAYHPLAI